MKRITRIHFQIVLLNFVKILKKGCQSLVKFTLPAQGRGRGGRGRGGARGRKIPAGRSYTAKYTDSDHGSSDDLPDPSSDGNEGGFDLPDLERDIVAELNCVARGEGSVGARGDGSGGATGQTSGRGRGLGNRKRKSEKWTLRSFDRSL